MTAYLIRRIGTSIVILIGISIFIFILLHSVFPSPAIVVLGPRAAPQAVAVWNAQNGFSDPVIVQYWHYMYALLHGNLGYSYKLNQSVAALFGERWARSLYLSGMGIAIAIAISVPNIQLRGQPVHLDPGGDRRLARDDAADSVHRPARARGLLQVHAVLGDGDPRPGLHQDGAG